MSFALDLNRSKSMAVKVEIKDYENNIPWGKIAFGIISCSFGICIYIFLPLSLLSMNINLLMSIFFFILMGLIFGFILLSFNIIYLLERFIVYVLLFFVKGAYKMIVLKNMASHRIKNRRTAVMYALSIGFIIFIYTTM